MKLTLLFPTIALLVLPTVALRAQAKPAGQSPQETAEFIREAEAGAPARIAAQATIARLEPNGKTTTVRQGSNRFTCTLLPDGSNAPYCGDESAFRWMVAAMSKQPKPPTTQPGIGYMAKGGVHFETPDGEIVMQPSAQTKEVKEPPHWMLLWPVDPVTSGIPTRPNAGGTYIMFAGTPYAHLMIYQDPNMLK
ncbi:MAG: hypothetical protein ACREMX_04945 [Gemmatimonadales bacterium]